MLSKRTVPLVGTHAAKCSAPDSRCSVPLALDAVELPGFIGIHSIPVNERLCCMPAGGAAEIPKAKELCTAYAAGIEGEPDGILAALRGGGAVYTQGSDAVDGLLPQIIVPGPDGSELSITPLTAPQVLNKVITAVGESENIRRTKCFAFVSKPQNLVGGVGVRGAIPHAEPPTRDPVYAARARIESDPEGWVGSQIKSLRLQPAFDAMVAHFKEALAAETIPQWMALRGNSSRNRLLAPIETVLRDLATDADDFSGLRERICRAVISLMERETGLMHATTRDWFTS